MTSFRFFHTADIHLDSPLRGLAGQEGSTAERIRTATREALDQLVGFAIEEQVAFLVIAGDLYDGDWRDYNTGLFLVRQMGRLHQAGIPVYLLYGNHDAESRITRRLVLPDNVHVFGSRRPQSFKIGDPGVVLHGQSFGQRAVTDNLALTYPEPVSGTFNIGVLHTGLGGMGGHDDYAPCSVADLVNKGYDYWALGHVHQAAVLHERPHVVFPGNLQGRHVREIGAKGATLVAVESGEVVELITVPCDVVRWSVVPVELADRRFDNAEAAARVTELSRAIDQREGDLCQLGVRREGLDREGERLDTDWESLWDGAPLEPPDPDVMLEWLGRRDELLEAIERRSEAASELEVLTREVQEARESLLAEISVLDIDRGAMDHDTLPVILERADRLRQEHESRAEAKARRDESLREAATLVARRRRELARAEEARSHWQEAWSAALAKLRLEAALGPDAVSARLEVIDQMRDKVGRISDLRHQRIGKINRDIADRGRFLTTTRDGRQCTGTQ